MSAVPTTPGSRLRAKSRRDQRRRFVNKAMEWVAAGAAVLAIAVLAIVVGSVTVRGLQALNLDFFTKSTPPQGLGLTTGGMANAIVGTILMVAIGTAIAVPIGVLVALYTNEFASRSTASFIRLALDILNGVPSIVIGIFVFGLLVVGHGQAAWIGGFALSLIEIPLIARSSQEVLQLVPSTWRDASAALGAPKWKTVVTVVIPSALGGIITGTALAIARVAGETAPILFASSIAANVVSADVTHAIASLPVQIFVYSESPAPHDHELAWAAALFLLVCVLLSSLVARMLLSRTRAKLEGEDIGGIGVGRLLGRLVEPMSRERKPDPPTSALP
jgi:phosphate transport system permease protein